MNREKIRRIFKDLRQQIAELKEQLESQAYYQEETSARLERRMRAYRAEEDERRRQEEYDRWYREEELHKTTRELDRAKSYGDEWGYHRALEKIKRM